MPNHTARPDDANKPNVFVLEWGILHKSCLASVKDDSVQCFVVDLLLLLVCIWSEGTKGALLWA